MEQRGLVPYGQGGQPMDPVSFLLYLLALPIRIMAEMLRNAPRPPVFPGQGSYQSDLWNVPTRPHQPNVIDAPSYTVREAPPQQPASTYVNEESWEIEWNEEGLPTRIIVHRNAQRA